MTKSPESLVNQDANPSDADLQEALSRSGFTMDDLDEFTVNDIVETLPIIKQGETFSSDTIVPRDVLAE